MAWDERIMPFNTTSHTSYSKWLNINGINRFVTDFDPNHDLRFTVKLRGWINEPCPAQWEWGNNHITCEYVLHGRQSQFTCCPHGLTSKGPYSEDCGCRDDLTETPYRLGYVRDAANDATDTTTFNFNIAMVDPWRSQDFDGVDFNIGSEVNCSGMNIKDLKLEVFNHMEVVDVTFNGARLDWQLTPNSPYSSWLWLLGVDYTQELFVPYVPMMVSITVRGSDATELCPASAVFGSSASCEYVVSGLSGPNYDQCCPKSVTSRYSPQRLQFLAIM